VVFSYAGFETVRLLLMKHVERTNCIYKKNNPGSENSLKIRISDIVHSISPAKLRCVKHSVIVSCNASLWGEGDYFQNLPWTRRGTT